MKKLLCIFLFIFISINTLGFKSQDSYIFVMETYYPLHEDIGCGYLELEVEMNGDDDFLPILEDIFKNPPSEGLIPSMPKKAHINSMSFDLRSRILNIDFSKEFLDYTFGSSLEYDSLRSIVNTLGEFYNIDKVSISIEGKLYESGHFALRPGEYFEVNLKDAIKIN